MHDCVYPEGKHAYHNVFSAQENSSGYYDKTKDDEQHKIMTKHDQSF